MSEEELEYWLNIVLEDRDKEKENEAVCKIDIQPC